MMWSLSTSDSRENEFIGEENHGKGIPGIIHVIYYFVMCVVNRMHSSNEPTRALAFTLYG